MALAALALAAATSAHAEEARSAHVLGQHPVAERVYDELSATGGAVVRRSTPLQIGCSRPLVEAELSRSAPGSVCVCVDAEGASTWQWVGDDAQLRDSFRWVEAKDGRLAAVRITEATRASLAAPALAGAPGDASLLEAPLGTIAGGGRPPRADDGVEGRLVADALVRGQHGAESGPPATRLGVGYSALGGIGGARSGLALEADFGLRRGLALSAFASLPLEPFPLSGRPEGTRAALWFVGVGLSHPLAPDGARVKPRVGAGFGFGWLSVQSQGTAQPGRLRGPPRSDDLASPAVYAVVGLSLRLIGPVHLSADVYGGATAARFVARDDRGASVGEWGWPLVGGAALGEVQF